jgi:hypothetical protein
MPSILGRALFVGYGDEFGPESPDEIYCALRAKLTSIKISRREEDFVFRNIGPYPLRTLHQGNCDIHMCCGIGVFILSPQYGRGF